MQVQADETNPKIPCLHTKCNRSPVLSNLALPAALALSNSLHENQTIWLYVFIDAREYIMLIDTGHPPDNVEQHCNVKRTQMPTY